MIKPLVSIITPVYNAKHYVNGLVENIKKQTLTEWELVFVETSGGDSKELILKLAKDDERIKYYQQENRGPGIARNFGVEMAAADFCAFIDVDDLWVSENKLKNQYDCLKNNNDIVMVGATEISLINVEGRETGKYFYPSSDQKIRNKMLINNCFATSAIMVRKTAFTKASGFKEMYLGEDYELWLRLCLLGKVANLSECRVAYRISDSSLSGKSKLQMYKNVLELVRLNKKNYPNYLPGIIKAYIRIFIYKLLTIAR